MKNIFYLLIVSLLIVQCKPTGTVTDTTKTNPGPVAEVTDDGGTLDRSIPPTAGAAPEIKIGDYDKFTLDNGMEVIVVTNDKLPRVSFSLQVDVDPVLEGEKSGMVDLTGQLMRRGTKSMTKAELDEEVDFIGANLSTSGTGISASSLSKHQGKLLSLMSEIILNSDFKDEELEKLKKQTISGLAANKEDPNAIAGNVADVLKYSKNHPYGEITTEETVKNVTVKDCEEYFNAYFKPNTTRLIIVGDVNSKTIKKDLAKYFGDWKEGDVPKNEYEAPSAPKAAEVAFVNKEGAVQSVITVTYPLDFKPGSQDAIKASVMNSMLGGGGFSARLMQNLREDKAYTYGAYSRLSSDELVGSFLASASVRNEVTDSSVTEFLYEMKRMRDEKVDEADLSKTLNKMTGSFSRALERPETVARFARNIEKYNLPKDYYKNYLKNLRAVTADDIQEMAKKYLHPNNAHILVVGNKEEVASKLAKFSADGKVHFYDVYGEPVKETKFEIPEGLTAKDVVQDFLIAIGGVDKLEAIESVEINGTMAAMGTTLSMNQKIETGKRLSLEVTMNGQVIQKQIFDGKRVANGGQVMEVSGKELESVEAQTYIADELYFMKKGFEMELKGHEKIEGSDVYKVALTSPNGVKSTHYYDVKSKLKIRSISLNSTPMGEISVTADMSDYKDVGNGVLVAHKQKQQAGPQTIEAEITSVELNKGFEANVFDVPPPPPPKTEDKSINPKPGKLDERKLRPQEKN